MSKKLVFVAMAGLSLAFAMPPSSARAGIAEDIAAARKAKAEEEKREAAEEKAKKAAEAKDEAARKAADGPSLKQMMDNAGKNKQPLSTKSAMEDTLKARLKGGSSMEDLMRKTREDGEKKDREKADKDSFINKINSKIDSFKKGLDSKPKEEVKEKTLLDEYNEKKAKEGGSVWDQMKKKTEGK